MAVGEGVDSTSFLLLDDDAAGGVAALVCFFFFFLPPLIFLKLNGSRFVAAAASVAITVTVADLLLPTLLLPWGLPPETPSIVCS